MTKILGISGSLTAGGSTRNLVDLALHAASSGDRHVTTDVIDLREINISFCDGRPVEEYQDDTANVINRIQAADAYVIGTPIYRGTYTGALKNLIDHVPVEAFCGKTVGLIGNAYTDHHYLSIDQELKTVLDWFNMHIVPGSVYVSADQMKGGKIVDKFAADHLQSLGKAVTAMSAFLKPEHQGPPPLVLWPR